MAVLFSNFVILTTALLFRVVLKRRLSIVQWASLMILFLSIVSLTTGTGGSQHVTAVHGLHASRMSSPSNGCLLFVETQRWNLSEAGLGGAGEVGVALPTGVQNGTLPHELQSFGLGHVLLVLQCFISSMANIYNEKILKEGEQLTESIFIQNSKLYLFGVAFNGLTLTLHSESRAVALHCGLLHGHNVYSLSLAVVTAALGLSVAFILKFRDNMFHVLTAQVTTVLITGVSLLAFDFRPSLDFFLHAPVVMLAIFVYNASRARDPEFALQQEKLRVLNGEVSERSRGDGEELERLTKADVDSESEDEKSL
ncbi:UDP-sugar transporter protein SLC35A5 isoform X2 [Scleropages formosus]|nr:probable UDP-sugar transporter protein SLC35A5 isoform X2 [Scleropages formosus]